MERDAQQARNDKENLREHLERDITRYRNNAQHLRAELDKEKEMFELFLRRFDKFKMLNEIKEYEELDEQDTLIRMKFAMEGGDQLKQEMARNFLKYSMVDKGLTEIGTLMEQTGSQALASTSLISNLLSDDEFKKSLNQIESEVTGKFQWIQTASARQVLQRCFRNPKMIDQSTQMGIDMFSEEREMFKERLAAMQTEICHHQDQKLTLFQQCNELKNQLVDKLQDIRNLKVMRENQDKLLEEQYIEINNFTINQEVQN